MSVFAKCFPLLLELTARGLRLPQYQLGSEGPTSANSIDMHFVLSMQWASYDEFQQRMEFAVQGSAGFIQL